MNKLFATTLVAATVLATGSAIAADAKWPTKPVQAIVPAGAGGDTDFNARTMAKYFEKLTGKPMIVTNVNGANGAIAMAQIKGGAADGNVLLFGHTGHLVVGEVSGLTTENYDSFDVACIPAVDKSATLISSEQSGLKSVQDLVNKAKAAPGTVIYGTEMGGYSHLQGLILEKKTGIKLKFVDSGTVSTRMTNMLAGRIDLAANSFGSIQDYVKTGKMNALAQYNNQANPLIAGVKTFRDQGFAFDMEKPYIIAFKKGTDPEIVKAMSDIMKKITEMPEYAKDLEQGFKQPVSFYDTKQAQDLLKEIRTDYMQYTDLLRQKK
ncbi:MAG: tripartite tricarboxylate transporter substrate binding protein [Burkholderiaceae bacterium]